MTECHGRLRGNFQSGTGSCRGTSVASYRNIYPKLTSRQAPHETLCTALWSRVCSQVLAKAAGPKDHLSQSRRMQFCSEGGCRWVARPSPGQEPCPATGAGWVACGASPHALRTEPLGLRAPGGQRLWVLLMLSSCPGWLSSSVMASQCQESWAWGHAASQPWSTLHSVPAQITMVGLRRGLGTGRGSPFLRSLGH